MRFAIVALFLLGLPVAGMADTPSPAKADPNDPNRVICRRESVTGSLAQQRKICMTRADWAIRSRNMQEGAQQMQDQGHVNSCGALTPGAC